MPLTLTMYHAVIDVKSIIEKTENTVINKDHPNADKKPVLSSPEI